jgi:O-methyltransferase
MTTTRQLYLDLLIKILANTIYEDPSINPANTGPFQPELRATGLDWPAVAHTLRSLMPLAARTPRIKMQHPPRQIPVSMKSPGICSSKARWARSRTFSSLRTPTIVWFAGLPPPNPHAYPQDDGWNFHRHKELAVSLDKVKDNFSRYGLLDDQVVFVKGLFADTLPSLNAGPFSLMRLDGDWYESTYIALDSLYPKLSPGGFVILDDVNFIEPCRQAVMDYRSRNGITATMYEVDWSASWWQKER